MFKNSFILALLLLCALVVVGKGLSERSDKLSKEQPEEISKISLINRSNTSNKSGSANNKFNMNKITESLTFRLPRAIKPSTYNLLLHPDLEKKTFSGNVKIDISLSEDMPYVPLHSKFLNITKVNLMKNLVNGGEGIGIKNSFEYPKFEYFVIEPESALKAGNYTIELGFNGSLDNKIVGFYGSSYFDKMRNKSR